MALKRKASFSTIISPRNSSSYYNATSPIPCMLGETIAIDETPHLHSRTRKRFRNDRPDDRVVYDNTLRWLFSAQKEAAKEPNYTPASASTSISTPFGESTPSHGNLDLTASSTQPDSNQQTLHKFFQATRPTPVNPIPSTYPNTSIAANFTPQAATHTQEAAMWPNNFSASNSGSSSMDVDMQMDVDSTNSAPPPSHQKVWVGGIGWM